MHNNHDTASPSIAENPHFNHIDRAPYELGHLLTQLPPDFSAYLPASQEALLIAEAAAQHASNANYTLLHGLEALGKVLYVAGDNRENELDSGSLADLGCLIQQMAVEMQFLQETESNLRHALHEHQARGGKEGK